MTIGPVMLDIQGTELSADDAALLSNPLVGGLIFFTRNYVSPTQIADLSQAVREAAGHDILLAVDHEGGRVQRFRHDFTRLPPLAKLGAKYEDDPLEALQLAHSAGWLMAAEVRAVGIDFSFAPVLDLDFGGSQVIGDRAFHRCPEVVTILAGAYIEGMREAGMASTGKHFPGHGWVQADSHLAIPRDNRQRCAIMEEDVYPFKTLFKHGLDAVMPAHVIYENVDDQPAGFSSVWLQDILRGELGFDGVIFSDDLSMEGASVAGGYAARAEAALAAGCDMVLACNNRAGALEILEKAKLQPSAASTQRLQRMCGKPFMNRSALLEQQYWRESVEQVTALV
ncbi:MAG: beta-N-acetylhexosaminidase [Thiothrix sp.]|uniref:beta-N-acetylhexosaminidase n=1 Tax=Thiothrix sp. TaxID=1032 RepID=UPI00262F8564|nr:beta-N-acetylhexosaminidase [Thiothrix sp.]MDD5394742.1 beta-N-acetylhexosaminidase [Thiothrix sp.]